MDLDAVLRRRPEVSLVDELAHTNVPGSGRHDKRWQDVLDILGAGIDVITTVNIRHLESIADAGGGVVRLARAAALLRAAAVPPGGSQPTRPAATSRSRDAA
jgi:hypothetical protein